MCKAKMALQFTTTTEPQKNKPNLLDDFIEKVGATIINTYAGYTKILVPVVNLTEVVTTTEAFFLPGQREIDDERVQRMVEEQQATYSAENGYEIVTSEIILGQCSKLVSDLNPYGLVIQDGQHRVACLELLCLHNRERFVFPVSLWETGPEQMVKMTLKIKSAENLPKLKEYFRRVNRNTIPVAQYNLDDRIATIVDGVVGWMTGKYNEYFRKSKSPHRPHLNEITLRDKLSDSLQLKNYLQEASSIEFDNICIEQICQMIETYNDSLKSKSYLFFTKNIKGDEIETCKKAQLVCLKRKEVLYVGMYDDYRWIDGAFEYTAKLQKEKVAHKIKLVLIKPQIILSM